MANIMNNLSNIVIYILLLKLVILSIIVFTINIYNKIPTYKIFFLLIILLIADVKSVLLWGKFTNISAILERIRQVGDRTLSNPIPDFGLGRKIFGDSVILVLKKRGKNNEEFRDEISKKHNNTIRKFMDLKKNRKEREKAELVKTQHDIKVNEIVKFLEDHYLTANYLYAEVQRIKRQRKVKDDLRRMIEYLEKPDKSQMKEEVLQFYYNKRRTESLVIDDIYHHKTNNLIINTFKDPYNDGFIN